LNASSLNYRLILQKAPASTPHQKARRSEGEGQQIEKLYCSNRSASTGFILAAFLAGTIPEITPTSVENTRAKIINCG
jgi:hypothetical protein